MSGADRAGAPLAALRQLARSGPAPAVGERCDMCAAGLPAAHSHVVDLHSRALLCACRPCYLLFTDEHAKLQYRAVPERYLSLPDTTFDEQAWHELQIPVGLAFLFRDSVQDRIVASYPGPAGATEADVPQAAWDRIVAGAPQLAMLRPDVEAVLVRRPARAGDADAPDPGCYLVPVDACYELVGRLRMLWRGIDGGREAHEAMEQFFARVRAFSRPAPPVGAA
ncbi:DUF5947 family protein [Amorphoplanes digitatis]|uniref:Uncharacterized protein n=1 Tax=Actinoplanes digitatis TaxID=1868 RepID=A0A7W7I036_9ACTN|nr:DUF5947 family protein [Actinoplanes digitatis]MBB4763914.1 hypothetical protein [Actinoplanes digitatis]GID93733.1 hypothetical protein Adi01nite_31450 [Actinoplanes digitatis]